MKGFPVIDMAATGENILKLRKESGLSVAQLQEFFGFDAPQAIYKWQRGETLPSTDNLVALSYLLDVPIDEILIRKKAIEKATPQEDSCGGPFSPERSIYLLILKIVIFSILEAIKIIHMIFIKIYFITITICLKWISVF